MVYDEITKLVSIIISMREPFDHHGSGTAQWAVKMTRELSMPEEEVKLIEVGAHLHDIGKLLIRADVLNAERKLNDVERAEMQTHALLGWSVVERAGYPQMILDIVRHHHEHWDGTGYPDGLRHEQIPFAARITGICDAYDALTSKRPYREAFSHNFAMAMVQKDKRTMFDPQLVDLFFTKVARG